SASNFDFTRSAASETALRRILLPPKMMNCREGLTLRSSGAAGRALQIRTKPKTPAALPNLDTTSILSFSAADNQHRPKLCSHFAGRRILCKSDGNEARLIAPV